MENNEEKVIEDCSEEVEKEDVETVDELVKEKADNEFIARENTGQIQIFLQNANFYNKSGIKQILDLVNLSTENDKKYNLRKIEDCADFFSTCKNKEYIVLAIVLSAFEIVPISDYANLKDILTEYLPDILQTDKDGMETYVQQKNSYISLNTALSVIGGKIFITDDGQQCIGYGEGFEEVLSNIWIQFLDLRNPVINWLLKINEMFEYKTSFEVHQVVGAFLRIIMEDFQYAKRQVFEKLYSDSNNLALIARLAQELLGDEKFKNEILSIVLKWAESESNWLWKSALLVCLYTYEPDIDKQLHKAMIRAIKKRIFALENVDLRFIVLFAGNSRNVRTIISLVFQKLCSSDHIQGHEKAARIYLKMIRYGYYQVNRNKMELPFVTCDSKEQIDNVHFVLVYIMTRYDLYCQLCRVLQAYLEEIAGYDVSSETLNHITAFFYVLTRDEYDYQKDILIFLSELNNSIAKKVYEKLMKIYRNNGGKIK